MLLLSPLWFLCMYVVLVCIAPAAVALHHRYGWTIRIHAAQTTSAMWWAERPLFVIVPALVTPR